MQIEPTRETDRVCKDLIGEGYKDLDDLWDKVQEVLARKGALDLCTTRVEDNQAMDILEEVFEEACRTANEERFPTLASEYVDYKRLWERLCDVLGVKV